VRYRLPAGSETDEFPAHQSDFHHARPVYETLPGWREPLDDVLEVDGLPEAARRYIEFVEEALDVPVCMIGTGAERERVVTPPGQPAYSRS
jgi:adenylosuccinate synthase